MAIASLVYYHVYVVHKHKRQKREAFLFNFKWGQVKRIFAVPYMKNRAILVYGRFVHPSDIDKIEIFESKELFQELILPNGKSPIDEKKLAYIVECFISGKVKDVKLCTHDFITSPPEEKEEPIKVPTTPLGKKEKVFIVHGRDHKPMKELKSMLSDFGLNPIVLHEQPSGSRTIVEKLEKYSDVGYAFVILTPDDVGGSRDSESYHSAPIEMHGRFTQRDIVEEFPSFFNTRARQNVVLEFGYFMGLLGRDRVCCLYKGAVELPSDMHGIVYIPFKDPINNVRNKIIKELKAAGYEIKV